MQLIFKIWLALVCLTIVTNCQCSASFCLACQQNTTNTCASCLRPFYTSSPNGICTLCSVSYCKSCSSTNVCSSCLDLFLLSNNACIFCNVTNCIECSTISYCSQCQTNYTQTNGSCLPSLCSINNCSLCEKDNICSKCLTKFTLNNNLCVYCNIDNCLNCSSENTCTSCSQSYILQNNNCVLCSISDCYFCNSTTSLCLACISGSTITNGYCVKNCPTNCKNCNTNTGVCIECSNGFTLKSNICISCSIANCLSCDSANQCISCSSGYTRINSTSCQCTNTQANSSCQCPINSTLSQNSCINNCGISNCISCSSNICSSCLTSYKLVNGSLCQAFCLIQNCQTCSVPNVCSKCLNNLKITKDGTSCVSCSVQNCDKCSSNDVCVLCQPGYSKASSSSCILCNIEFCQYCPLQGVCQYCYFPYAPSFDALSCVICLFPCVYCNNNGSCLVCDRPFSRFPMSNGTCYLCQDQNCQSCNPSYPGICLSCRSGYQNINGACHGNCINSGCKICDINKSSICLECLDYYYMNGNAQCLFCSDKYICQKCSPTNSSICLKCKDRFYLSGAICYPCPSYCLVCSSSSVCITTIFEFGYTLVNENNASKLSICDSWCLNCVLNNPNHCYQCFLGYYLSDSINGSSYCIPCSNNCQVCNNANCINCFPGAYLSNSTCALCSRECATCTQSASNCTSCQYGDTLTIDNKCISSYSRQCSQNCGICLYYGGSYTCQSCSIGYILSNNSCLPCQYGCSFCNTSIISQCLMCSPMYYIDSGSCYPCKSNCLNCLSSSDCILCLPGFIMTSKITCVPVCSYPCSTCAQTNAKFCLSCIAGYSLNTKTNECTSDVSCSVNGTCIVCPAGYIFSYNSPTSQTCVKCDNPSQFCLRCSPLNSTICLNCLHGYYLNSSINSCTKCPQNCSICYSYDYCMVCADSFVVVRNLVSPTIILISHYFEGIYYQPIICIKCYSPCSTCYNLPSFCTSCISKYTLSDNRCISNFNFLVSLTLNPASNQTFVENYYSLISLIANATNTFINETSIIWIKYSSVNIRLLVSTSNSAGSTAANQQQSNLTNLLASTSMAGMTVINSQLTVQGVDSSNRSSNNLGVIIASALVGGIFIIGAIFILGIKYRRRLQKQKTYKPNTKVEEFSTQFVDIEIKYKKEEMDRTKSLELMQL